MLDFKAHRPDGTTIIISDWPRGLTLRQAAAYVGVPVARFRAEVRAGKWHTPHGNGRNQRFDRLRLDREFEALFGRKNADEIDLDHELGIGV